MNTLESTREELHRQLKQNNLIPNDHQFKWRTNPPKYPYEGTVKEKREWWKHCELAIIDALITQGCITAWPGDGVGCVTQIVKAQADAFSGKEGF